MAAQRVVFILVVVVVMGLLLMPATAQEMVTSLSPGFAVHQSVTESDPSHQYHVAGMTDASVFILLMSEDYDNAPAVTLTNDITNQPIATLKLAVNGMCLRLAPGHETYTLSVSADHAIAPQGYALLIAEGSTDTMMCGDDLFSSLWSGGAGASAGGTVVTSRTTIGTIGTNPNNTDTDSDDDSTNPAFFGKPSTTCFATSPNQLDVNVRSDADPNARIIGDINAGTVAPVYGTVSGNDFLLVNSDEGLGLAASPAVALGGDCFNVPLIEIDGDTARALGSGVDLGLDLDVDSGLIDTNGNLIDLNGVLDRDGQGSGSRIDVMVDTNGDGLIDVDLNGDGILDVDSNGDGLIDIDLDGDGILDVDLNGDGILDVDLNGDGLVDVDLNGDGLLDIGGNGGKGGSLIDLDANTNDGLDVDATVDGNGNDADALLDLDVDTDNGAGVDLDVNNNGGSGAVCVNALGVEVLCD